MGNAAALVVTILGILLLYPHLMSKPKGIISVRDSTVNKENIERVVV